MSKLPVGWAEATIGEVAEVNPPKSVVDLDSTQLVSFVPMQAVSEVTGEIDQSEDRRLEAVSTGFTQFQEGDLIVAKITPSMENGKAAVARSLTNGIGFGSTEFHVLRSVGAVDPDFLWRFVRQQDFRDRARSVMRGAVGQQRVPPEHLRNHSLWLPPLNEQRRIVAKLDRLLTSVARARGELDRVPILIARYKDAILTKAFSGELTAEWRAKHAATTSAAFVAERQRRIDTIAGEEGRGRDERSALLRTDADLRSRLEFIARKQPLPEQWAWAGIGQVFGTYIGATPSRKEPRYWNGSINWVSSGEVSFRRISSTAEHITDEGLDNASTRIHQPGTVLLGMIGEGKTRGQAAILDVPACNNQNCAAIRVSEAGYSPEYVYWYLYLTYEETRNTGTGNNQPALNKDRVQRLPIPLAPVEEATEIVRVISAAFAWLDVVAIEQPSAAKLLPKLEQAILAKAFRGDLVPQDPADEPASALLKRIHAARATGTKSQPRRGRGSKPPRAPEEKAAMTKSRFDPDVKDQPYLAGLIKNESGRTDVESLFRRADLPVADFYKQLAWEISAGHVRDAGERLEAA